MKRDFRVGDKVYVKKTKDIWQSMYAGLGTIKSTTSMTNQYPIIVRFKHIQDNGKVINVEMIYAEDELILADFEVEI